VVDASRGDCFKLPYPEKFSPFPGYSCLIGVRCCMATLNHLEPKVSMGVPGGGEMTGDWSLDPIALFNTIQMLIRLIFYTLYMSLSKIQQVKSIYRCLDEIIDSV
jgi:hypothetical protein